MPLPLILGIGALAAGAVGIKSALEGVDTMQKSKERMEQIEKEHKDNIDGFEQCNKETAEKMDSLAIYEFEILESFELFSDLIEKIQNRPEFQAYNKEGVELPKYDANHLKDVSIGAAVLLGGLSGAALGTAGGFAAAGATTSAVMALGTASTGTAIASLSGAAATNATLAALGGGALGSSALAGGMALGSTVLGMATLGVGILVGGAIFKHTGTKLSEEVEEAYSQMKKAEEKINAINKYLIDLRKVASDYIYSLEQVNHFYRDYLSKLRYVVEELGKTDWNDFTEEEKLVTQNLVLLVGLLYKMCQVQLVEKTDDEDGINTINRDAVNKSINDAGKVLNIEAERIVAQAKDVYNTAKESLNIEQNKVANELISLGKAKISTLDGDVKRFLNIFEKIKFLSNNKRIKGWKLEFSQEEAMRLQRMLYEYKALFGYQDKDIVESAAIVLAIHSFYPIETGRLQELRKNNLEVDNSITNTFSSNALLRGARCVSLGCIEVPTMKFYEPCENVEFTKNIENARKTYSVSENVAKTMKQSEACCAKIIERAKELEKQLNQIGDMFKEPVLMLEQVINEKTKIYRRKLKASMFSWEELEIIQTVCMFARIIREYMEQPILKENGALDMHKRYILSNNKEIELLKVIENMKPLVEIVKQENSNLLKREAWNKYYGISVLVAFVMFCIGMSFYTDALLIPLLIVGIWAGIGMWIWLIWKFKLAFNKRYRRRKKERVDIYK